MKKEFKIKRLNMELKENIRLTEILEKNLFILKDKKIKLDKELELLK